MPRGRICSRLSSPGSFSVLRSFADKAAASVVLADCGQGDWLLCQITSNPYADSRAVEIRDADFQTGSLRKVSYARPSKLFTAHESLIFSKVGVLKAESIRRIIDRIVEVLRPKL